MLRGEDDSSANDISEAVNISRSVLFVTKKVPPKISPAHKKTATQLFGSPYFFCAKEVALSRGDRRLTFPNDLTESNLLHVVIAQVHEFSADTFFLQAASVS